MRNRGETAKRIAEVLVENPYLGKALALGFKVLLDREYRRFEALVLEGRYGEAGALALVWIRSPKVPKFPNRRAPFEGWKELAPVVERSLALGDTEVVEGAVRLKMEGDEAEVLLLLELQALGQEALPVLGRTIKAMVEHLPDDRYHGASEVPGPFLGKGVVKGG
ncbi:hypothetical protein [Thermus albus]|uniref:hypothetical protein n=1 Tax=Thermus albus TaxID=2908146 RepID=UPI001FAA975F|nr:hypothetical protein [Thermus albus]